MGKLPPGLARAASLIVLASTSPFTAMAIDLAPLWDFDHPDRSEARFRAALAGASADDALVLQTQIARSHGLRGDFTTARDILVSIEPGIAAAGPEARTRHALELGRTFASAVHPPASQTPDALAQARAAYRQALEIARAAQLDDLSIDALHMLAFVNTAPADQLAWGEQALAVALASAQPAARKWEASLRNNIGYALHQLGRYDEALVHFERAVALREASGNAGATRAARWMVGWTWRAMKRDDDALALQSRLERECEAAGEPDAYVFEELEALYRALGDAARADAYAEKRRASAK